MVAFSVLLPTHARPDVLGLAIRSVLAQTETELELLLCLDGVGDATRAVVAGFPDPRIRAFAAPKGPGFGYALRNVALREARGRFLAFQADDDLWLPDHLATLRMVLEGTGAPFAYTRPLWVSADGVVAPVLANLQHADELHRFLTRHNVLNANCWGATMDAVRAAGLWPEDVAAGGDWMMWRRIHGATGRGPLCWPVPTALHFTAARKATRWSDLREMKMWLAVADAAPWWPAWLRHAPAPTPQAAIWAALEASGPAAMRAAADEVVARLAWMTVREVMPRLEEAGLALGAGLA